eukprot:9197397-Lingulodinium_polyedra.AAC.1
MLPPRGALRLRHDAVRPHGVVVVLASAWPGPGGDPRRIAGDGRLGPRAHALAGDGPLDGGARRRGGGLHPEEAA